MQRTLTNWQAFGLLFPGFIGFLLEEFHLLGPDNLRLSFSAANMLWVFNILLILAVQAYFTVSFDKANAGRISLPSLNAAIPVGFFTFYFLFVVYSAMTAPATTATETIGPIREVRLSTANYVLFFMIAYSAISFLFVNNWLVKRRILEYADSQQRVELAKSYLYPMRRLVKAAVTVVGGIILFSVFYDIVKLAL